VPARGGERIALSLFPAKDESLLLDPWPFGAERVAVQAEGKRLEGRFSTKIELRRALRKADAILVRANLRRA
jgi:hypothetical protein